MCEAVIITSSIFIPISKSCDYMQTAVIRFSAVTKQSTRFYQKTTHHSLHEWFSNKYWPHTEPFNYRLSSHEIRTGRRKRGQPHLKLWMSWVNRILIFFYKKIMQWQIFIVVITMMSYIHNILSFAGEKYSEDTLSTA